MTKIETLIPLVKPYYPDKDPAHDWAHVERVAGNARSLAQNTGVDLLCLLAAAYCHDLVNLPKDHPQRAEASTLAAQKAQGLLMKSGFIEREIELIKQAIIEHSFSKGLTPTSLEAQLLQDADRLDALGAIGILRCAAVSAKMKGSFYHPEDPFGEGRDLDDRSFMLDHYSTKLFRLPELMNTKNGKAEAQRRVEVMRDFVQELTKEIQG